MPIELHGYNANCESPDDKATTKSSDNGRGGNTVTEFVVASAQEAATNAIKDFAVLHLRNEAREIFVNAILNPPAPNQAARAAAKRYRKQIGFTPEGGSHQQW